ncbi:MAG: hypothetical protein AAF471_09815, partial [Myxococcota bacterium]
LTPNHGDFQVEKIITISRIAGFFDGWYPNQTYLLMDGSEWQQVSQTVRCKSLDSPNAKIVRRGDKYYLRVTGIRGHQQVRPAVEMRAERIAKWISLLPVIYERVRQAGL